jgi:hypothetical protein
MAYPLIKLMQEEFEATGLSPGDIDNLMGVIESVFGTEMLDNWKSKQKDYPLDQHPVIIGSTSGSFEYLVELMELGTYLLSFKSEKEISKLIADLKDASSYGDTVFQLAMAYRFKKLGFSVQLEPPIRNNQLADFVAELGDMRVMCECTVLREWSIWEEQRRAFAICLNQLRKLYKKGATQIILSIVTKSSLSFKLLPQIQESIMRVGSQFLRDGQPLTEKSDEYEISIVEMDQETKAALDADARAYYRSQKDWGQQVSFTLGEPAIPGDITTVDLSKSTHESLMRHRSENEPKEQHNYSLEDRLDKKVSSKLKQLGSHPVDCASILCIGVEDKIDGVDWDRVGRRLAGSIFKQVPNLTAILIARNEWLESQKHQYNGLVYKNDTTALYNQVMFDALNVLERDMNPVSEWKSAFQN